MFDEVVVRKAPRRSTVWKDPVYVQELLKLWAEGLSAKRIADRISVMSGQEISRNSVISRVDDLRRKMGAAGPARREPGENMRSRQEARAAKNKRAEARARVAAQSGADVVKLTAKAVRASWASTLPPSPKPDVKPWVDPLEMIRVPEEKRVSVDGLRADQCRWPIGDPRDAGFHFCDREKVSGLSYCLGHAYRAYKVPAQNGKINTNIYAAGIFVGADGQIINPMSQPSPEPEPAAGAPSERETEDA